ncbi:MAG TPA: sugar transferase [Pseudomonadales bacterium]|nr:sugar transferase [Pseudomonadales bacterium]
MKPVSAGRFISASSNFTMLALIALDIGGALIIFNIVHRLITGYFAPDLLLTWKLVIIAAFIFLYNYLMDLYTFDSPLSQLGMLERSFIAMLLTGITVALTVYLIGPEFIGGFVGRGVLATSLIMVWLWSLSVRYMLNNWFRRQRSQIAWIVLTDGDISQFVQHFRSIYGVEQLLLLGRPGNAADTMNDPAIESAGNWDHLESLLQQRQVSGIIVTAPDRTPEALIDRLMDIRIGGVRIYTLSDFYEKYLARLPVFFLDQQWLTMAHGFELIHNPIGLRFKRYIDIVVALAGGLVALPIMFATAIAIVFTSGVPILYRQVRTGENGKPFTVYKFRTMIPDAEADGAQFTRENDPRVTPVGRIIRKFRLDELPQLWNVLVGDMSLIGPRPERPEFIAQLEVDVPWYNLRHIVKPGITGWAQVMYKYGDSSTDAVEKLQYDLFYIKNYSLLLDISIMVRSIKVILFGAGR